MTQRAVAKVEQQSMGPVFKPQTESLEVPINRPSGLLREPTVEFFFENRVAIVSHVRDQILIILAVRKQVDRRLAHVFQCKRQAR